MWFPPRNEPALTERLQDLDEAMHEIFDRVQALELQHDDQRDGTLHLCVALEQLLIRLRNVEAQNADLWRALMSHTTQQLFSAGMEH
jgi:hypothetical protein